MRSPPLGQHVWGCGSDSGPSPTQGILNALWGLCEGHMQGLHATFVLIASNQESIFADSQFPCQGEHECS